MEIYSGNIRVDRKLNITVTTIWGTNQIYKNGEESLLEQVHDLLGAFVLNILVEIRRIRQLVHDHRIGGHDVLRGSSGDRLPERTAN